MAQRQRPPKVMVDATVLIAGSAFPRWPHEVLRHALKGDFTLVLCPLVIRQAKAHLAKDFPNFLKGFETFLINCAYELVEEPSSEEVEGHPGLIRDKKDIPIALAAIKAKVNYFVSEDKDFTAKDVSTKELRKYLRPMLSGLHSTDLLADFSLIFPIRLLPTAIGRLWNVKKPEDLPLEICKLGLE